MLNASRYPQRQDETIRMFFLVKPRRVRSGKYFNSWDLTLPSRRVVFREFSTPAMVFSGQVIHQPPGWFIRPWR